MRKLMKYEFRALWRIFVPCWLAILALGFLNSLTLYQPNHNPWGAMLSAMGVFFYVLGTMAVLVLALFVGVQAFDLSAAAQQKRQKFADLAMEQLKKMDDVAYVRFASVYRQFSDVNTFMDELKDMLDSRAKNGGMQG